MGVPDILIYKAPSGNTYNSTVLSDVQYSSLVDTSPSYSVAGSSTTFNIPGHYLVTYSIEVTHIGGTAATLWSSGVLDGVLLGAESTSSVSILGSTTGSVILSATFIVNVASGQTLNIQYRRLDTDVDMLVNEAINSSTSIHIVRLDGRSTYLQAYSSTPVTLLTTGLFTTSLIDSTTEIESTAYSLLSGLVTLKHARKFLVTYNLVCSTAAITPAQVLSRVLLDNTIVPGSHLTSTMEGILGNTQVVASSGAFLIETTAIDSILQVEVALQGEPNAQQVTVDNVTLSIVELPHDTEATLTYNSGDVLQATSTPILHFDTYVGNQGEWYTPAEDSRVYAPEDGFYLIFSSYYLHRKGVIGSREPSVVSSKLLIEGSTVSLSTSSSILREEEQEGYRYTQVAGSHSSLLSIKSGQHIEAATEELIAQPEGTRVALGNTIGLLRINSMMEYSSKSSITQHNSVLSEPSGGTPIPLLYNLDTQVASGLLLDITPLQEATYAELSWDISYDTLGGSTGCEGTRGLNTTALNTNAINTCPPSTLGGTTGLSLLQQTYVLGDKIWEITQTNTRATDVLYTEFEVTQSYALRYELLSLEHSYSLDAGGGTTNLREFEFGQEYNIIGLDWVLELLGYVNDHRLSFGLIPIEGIWDPSVPDIAQGHSNNMAAVGVIAHDSLLYPPGWETTDNRVSLLDDSDQVTAYAENLMFYEYSPAQIAMGNDWTGINGRTFSHISPLTTFLEWKDSPPHNAVMLWPWEYKDHPVMAIGEGMVNEGYTYNNISSYITQIFLAYGIPLGVKMNTSELMQTYTVTGAGIVYLSQEYLLDAITPVKVQHIMEYGIKISTSFNAPYRYRVAVGHSTLNALRVTYAHTSIYADATNVKVSLSSLYDLSILSVRLGHDATYSTNISQSLASTYNIKYPVIVSHVSHYGDIVPVEKGHTTEWGVRSNNKVHVGHKSYWVNSTDTITSIIHSTILSIGGKDIPIQEAIISSSEGRVSWSCKVILDKPEDHSLFIEGSEFTIDMGGDIYNFVYSTKGISRGGVGEVTYTVEGLSRVVLLQPPRASTISKTYEVGMSAKSIIEDLLGTTVQWDFLPWHIPANLVSFEDADPVEVAVGVLASAGALLESNYDGSLLVRSKYPVPTSQYYNVTPDEYYYDLLDNLSSSEQYEVREGFNIYRVTNTDMSYSDKLEYIQGDSELEGLLRAYPTPWRTTIDIQTTSQSSVILGERYWSSREEESIVEFTAGVASIPYIADSIISVVWYSEQLSGLVHERYSDKLTVGVGTNKGYGLAKIVYKTSYLECSIQGSPDQHTQCVIAE